MNDQVNFIGDPLRSEEKKGPPRITNGHPVRFLPLLEDDATFIFNAFT